MLRLLPPNNSKTGAKFETWFGSGQATYDPVVRDVYAEASAFSGFKVFWCPNASFPGDDPGTFAFVPRGKGPFGEVFVETAFFSAPTSGADSQAGSIIHEMTHLSAKRGVVDVAYGTAVARALASNQPLKARINADNFEYFAEDVTDGIR